TARPQRHEASTEREHGGEVAICGSRAGSQTDQVDHDGVAREEPAGGVEISDRIRDVNSAIRVSSVYNSLRCDRHELVGDKGGVHKTNEWAARSTGGVDQVTTVVRQVTAGQ